VHGVQLWGVNVAVCDANLCGMLGCEGDQVEVTVCDTNLCGMVDRGGAQVGSCVPVLGGVSVHADQIPVGSCGCLQGGISVEQWFVHGGEGKSSGDGGVAPGGMVGVYGLVSL